MVVCLGVVPFGVEHPQVPRLGEALARSGFAALLYWSAAMRDFRLDPDDIQSIAMAYRWLVEQPYVDEERSGLLGTCVGGSFALMAAANPLIRDCVAFVTAYAPYSSISTFVQDIASATKLAGKERSPWRVDPLTRKVYVHSMTAGLASGEAELLRSMLLDSNRHIASGELSESGRAVYPLLTALAPDEVEPALQHLPSSMQELLAAISPVNYLHDIHTPLIVLFHDRDDVVIPVSESRQLLDAFTGRPGVHYTEFSVFQHLDPTKGKPSFLPLLKDLARFFVAMHPLFRQAVGV
jgi:hypothetical protein